MLSRALIAKKNPTTYPYITPTVQQLVGSQPPPLIRMSQQDLLHSLANRSLDIGMCGLFTTLERMDSIDFTTPFYSASGLQAVVPRPFGDPGLAGVLIALAQSIEEKAQLMLLLLLLFVFVFGHLVAACESISVDDALFRRSYLEGSEVALRSASAIAAAANPARLPDRPGGRQPRRPCRRAGARRFCARSGRCAARTRAHGSGVS